MHGLALKLNTVTFSTYYSESERSRAGHYHQVMKLIAATKAVCVMQTRELPLKGFRTPEIYAKLLQKYPEFVLPDSPNEWGDPHDHGGAEFQQHRFECYAFQLLAEHPDFIETVASAPNQRYPESVRSSYLFTAPDPWEILPDDEIGDIAETLEWPSDAWLNSEHYGLWKRIKWRWSAAVMCVHFLKSIPPSTRLHLRNIVLLEDRPSVASPHCKQDYCNIWTISEPFTLGHAHGLIPYCAENSRLRIERHVNLW